jgi:hypothetical protein
LPFTAFCCVYGAVFHVTSRPPYSRALSQQHAAQQCEAQHPSLQGTPSQHPPSSTRLAPAQQGSPNRARHRRTRPAAPATAMRVTAASSTHPRATAHAAIRRAVERVAEHAALLLLTCTAERYCSTCCNNARCCCACCWACCYGERCSGEVACDVEPRAAWCVPPWRVLRRRCCSGACCCSERCVCCKLQRCACCL